MDGQGKSGIAGGVPRFVWVVACVLAAVVVVYALATGSSVTRVGIPGGGAVEFEKNSPLVPASNVNEVSAKELSENQKKLEERLNNLQNNLQNNTSQQDTSPITAARNSIANVSGLWGSPYGVSYYINQSGNRFIIQEISPIYGITAVGQGTINGSRMDLAYTTALATGGSASLQIAPDGRQISGSTRDAMSGLIRPMILVR
jgi:hypothetical protein